MAMAYTKLLGVLLGVILVTAGPAGAVMEIGDPDDDVVDLRVGGGGRQLTLLCDNVYISGISLQSAGCVLTGEPYVNYLGFFHFHTDCEIADSLFMFTGRHELGSVLGDGVDVRTLPEDLTLIYAIAGETEENFATILFVGDANLDGWVDDNDLSLLLAGWGQDTDWGHGEFSEADPVDDADLSLLLANWTGPPDTVGIPEPAVAGLLATGGMFLLRRRRQ